MPFNGTGVFQRLFNWRNDRDAGVKILAERMDQEFDGVVAAINAIVGGERAFRGAVKVPNGTAASPAYSFDGHTDCGLFRKPNGDIGISVDGSEVGTLSQSFFAGIAANTAGIATNAEHIDTKLPIAGGTMTGALNLPAGGLSVGPGHLEIDAAGVVNTPNQPAVSVRLDQTSTFLAKGTDVFAANAQFDVNQGISFNPSTGRFTITKAGMYPTSFYTIKKGAGESHVGIYVNGVNKLSAYSNGVDANWVTLSCWGILDLAVGDYIDVRMVGATANHIAHGASHLRFAMYLLG